MARLQDLPCELVAMIMRNLPDHEDKKNFGRTCRGINEIAKPEVFRCVTISTHPTYKSQSAFNVPRLVEQYSQYIKELTVRLDPAYWEGHRSTQSEEVLQEDNIGDEDVERLFQEAEGLWQAKVGPLLSLLRGDPHGLTSGIQTLILDLPEDYTDGTHGVEINYRILASGKITLRRLDAILEAAALNSTITTLRVYNLPPYNSPVFKTVAWHDFLARVAHCQMSVLTVAGISSYRPHRSRKQMYVLVGVLDFFTEITGAYLAQNFLNHMLSVESIHLWAPGFGYWHFMVNVLRDRAAYDHFLERFKELSNEDLRMSDRARRACLLPRD